MFALSSAVVVATLWILAGFSVISWTVILHKGWLQWRQGRRNRDFARAFWNAPDLAEARQVAQRHRGPLARLCRAGLACLEGLRQDAGSTLERSGDRQDILERTLRRQVQNEQHRLEGGLMALASIGSTAPFVGLFGTVWGIMHALESIGASGAAGLDVVAGPVGEALIATAVGIATAIPAVLAYNYGLRRVRLSVAELEDFAVDFLHLAMKAGFALEGKA